MATRIEQGPVRPEQQDRLVVLDGAPTPWGPLDVLAVFDGMGGMPRGGEASRAAADALPGALAGADDGIDVLRRLNEAVRPTGGGTTAVVAVLDGATVHLATVGDSAAYRFGDAGLELLLPKDAVGPTSLTDFLGNRTMEGHTRELEAQAGDILLLCSDGVDGVLGPTDLEPYLDLARTDAKHGVERMFADIRAAGMPDNAAAAVAVRG